MRQGNMRLKLAAALLAATALQGCQSVNVLAAIDGPYVSPSEREAIAMDAQVAPAATAQPVAEYTVDPAPVAAEPAAMADAPQEEMPQLAMPEPVAEEPPAAAIEIEAEENESRFVGPILPPEEMAQLARSDDADPAEDDEPIALIDPNLDSDIPALATPTLPEDEAEEVAFVPETIEEERETVEQAFAPVQALLPAEATPDEAPATEELALAVPVEEPEAEELALALPAEEAEAPAIGSDFLPPEPVAAEPARPALAAVDVAEGPAIVGPMDVEDEPVALRTRLPSAFDVPEEEEPAEQAEERVELAQLGPRPSASSSSAIAVPNSVLQEFPAGAPDAAEAELTLPEVEADEAPAAAATDEASRVAAVTPLARQGGSELTVLGATGSATYSPFFNHAMARLNAASGSGNRSSMLLADPPSLRPDLKPCGNLPPAVLIDLDPAGGLLPLAGDNRPIPSLAGYLQRLREAGVTVNWISGHGPEGASAIRTILRETGLDPLGFDPLIVSRFAGESKQERRMELGESYCLLAIAGDRRADFDELYDFVRDPVMAAPLERLVGDGWFLAPPPID